jgi:hypothetical protein
MSRCHAALAVSDFFPDNDAPPPTKRFGARDLAAALAAMDLVDGREEGPTLLASHAEHRSFVVDAFRSHCAARPLTDDEPTLEAPAPRLPAGIPSPLGDDPEEAPQETGLQAHPVGQLVAAVEIPKWAPEETLTLHDLGIDLDDELPFLTDVPSLGSPPASTERPIAHPTRGGGTRATERNTRLFVIALWTVAIGMSSVLAYLMATASAVTP